MAKELTNKEKEEIIREAKKTSAGREALAKAIVEGMSKKMFGDKNLRKCHRCGKVFTPEKGKSTMGCSKCVEEVHEGKPFLINKKIKKLSRFDLLDL